MMRRIFITSGLLAIVASTAMSLTAAGGIEAPSAPGLIAMGIVLAIGAAAIGGALERRYIGIAIVIGLGMLAGEFGAMLQTAQRITAAREAQRAPLAGLVGQRKAALAELAAVEAEKPDPITTQRLDAATIAKSAAEKTVADKAADKGCRENCRQLLQAAVDAAGREVETARAEIAEQGKRQATAAADRIAKAKSAVDGLPPPQSATPLADNTGIPEWLLDVLEALALSLAINLPASALVALGVKMSPAKPAETKIEQKRGAIEAVAVTPRDHAVKFALDVLTPGDSHTPVAQLHGAYRDWCDATGYRAFPPREIGGALLELFGRTGVEIGDIGGKPHLLGASMRRTDRKRVLGPMTRIGVNA